MADDVNDDVERALAAYGGTGFTYRTFEKFSIRPRVPVVTRAPQAPAATTSAAPAARDIATAAVPAIRVSAVAMSPVEVADAEADMLEVPAAAAQPPAGEPLHAMFRLPAAPPPRHAAPPVATRQPMRPPPVDSESRLAGVRARRAGLAASAPPVARPAAPAQVSTAAVPPQSASRFGATPAQPVPAAAAATGNFHMDWGGPEATRERAERPAAASGEPPRPAPPPASGEKELFRRL